MCVGNSSEPINVNLNVPFANFESLGLDHSNCNCDYISLEDAILTKTSKGDLAIMQLNICGLLSKQVDLIRLVNSCITNSKIDIVILCETWLNDTTSHLVNIPGYTYIGNVRQMKKGGGVGFLISKELHYKVCPTFELSLDCIESSFVEIITKGRNILLGSIYRPPNTNEKAFNKEIESIMGKIKLETQNDVVIGLDHNLDFLKSEKHTETANFIGSVLDNSLLPCITRPTGVTNNSATLIDNILVSFNLHTLQRSAIIVHDISDHFPSLTILDVVNQKKRERQKIKKTHIRQQRCKCYQK